MCVCEHACVWVDGFVQSRNRSAHSIYTTTRGVTCLLQRNRVFLVSLLLLVQLHCTCKKKSTEVDGQKHLTHTDMHTHNESTSTKLMLVHYRCTISPFQTKLPKIYMQMYTYNGYKTQYIECPHYNITHCHVSMCAHITQVHMHMHPCTN